MIEGCVACGKTNAPGNVYCEDCRKRVWELYRDVPSEWKDALNSIDLAEGAVAIYKGYDVEDLGWGVIADYLMLIGVGLKSEADLRGLLVKEGKLEPNKARTFAREIMTLYSG